MELQIKNNSPNKKGGKAKIDDKKIKLQSKEEHFLDLRDENIQLKKRQMDLEEDVKQ
jgi:hypothetical protein